MRLELKFNHVAPVMLKRLDRKVRKTQCYRGTDRYSRTRYRATTKEERLVIKKKKHIGVKSWNQNSCDFLCLHPPTLLITIQLVDQQTVVDREIRREDLKTINKHE